MVHADTGDNSRSIARRLAGEQENSWIQIGLGIVVTGGLERFECVWNAANSLQIHRHVHFA